MAASRGAALALAPLLLVTAIVAGGRPPAAESAATPRVDHGTFDRILADVVRGEGVDYPRLRERHAEALTAYLARLRDVPADRLPRDPQLAFYINLYNATVLREVVARYEPGYSVSRDSFSLFDERIVPVGPKTISLNDLEHRVIRPGFDEPRIHVALVCAARSCPPLLPRAYRADDLDELLEAKMTSFVNGGVRNEIDVDAGRLRLSRLFDWYADDFGGPAGRGAYVDQFTEADVAGFEIEFLEYDWALNLAPSAR